MNTDLLSNTSEVEEEDNITRYEPAENMEGSRIQLFRPILKWFGLLSTIAWGVAALSPQTFKVPAPLQGWVFIISILWFFAYCIGLFNL